MTDSILAPDEASSEDDEISLLDLAIVLAKHKTLIIGLPVVAAIASIGVSLLMPNIYTAITKILPPQQTQSTSAALAQLAGGIGGLGGVKADLYIGMLKSRTVADGIIRQYDLTTRWEMKLQSDTRKRLEGVTAISAGKDGIIVLEVDDQDPQRAAELANAYVSELLKLTKVLAVTEASQRRLFFEVQVAQAKDNLTKAESAARYAMESGGIVQVDTQGRAMIEATARLRAQIALKEVQLGAMRSFAADRNPDLLMVQREIEAMKRELGKLEGVPGAQMTESSTYKGAGITSLGLLRDVKYNETLFELLAKQYEIAKIDEAKDASVIQVIDKAVAPDRKSKPKRALIVMLATVAAGVLAVLLAFIREALAKAAIHPVQRSRIDLLRSHLKQPLRIRA